MRVVFQKTKLYLLLLLVVLSNVLLVHMHFRNKFQDVTIELGTEKIDVNQFIVARMYRKSAKCLTDLSVIDISKVGEHTIELSYGGKTETVKLSIEDTTPPEVEFLDLEEGPNYELNAEDFVKVVHDESDYTITTTTEIEELNVGKYTVVVVVEDDYGNKTARECELVIQLVYDEIDHELGEKLTKKEILLDENVGSDALTKTVLAAVDVNTIGDYELITPYEGEEYTTLVHVKDTQGPTIVVNNLTVYVNSKKKSNEAFVKKVTDPSGVKKVKYEGNLDYSKIGVQKLKITATDNLGNVSTATATLTVKEDDDGPVFSGLTNIKIKKNETINYTSGVKAVDKKDGECEFTVDTSKVDVTESGTYYAVYTSSDKSGNVTTKKRKIVVSYDADDVEKMFDEYFEKYLKGKTVLEMTKYIKTHISYTHKRGSDPLYIALTQKKGSCYGHALLLKKALDKLEIPNYMIETTNKTHYWNLVYEDGKWRHYDSTPGSHITGPATDKEKLNSWAMAGRKWDTSKYPKAE